MSDLMDFDEKQKNDIGEQGEQQFITEKIVNKRKRRWVRRLFTFLILRELRKT